ncbi:MAG: phenylalanine--tRNA ligase subunit beta [Burkholderiales bacterium]
MRFSEKWLRTFVDPPIGSEDLANALTMAGLEIESVEPAGPPFEKVIIAEVLDVKPHPNADRLSVCSVATGAEGSLQIVCGAPNVAQGMKVPCALPGAQLPQGSIGAATVRGIRSEGMLCSAKELGLSDDVSGLLVLDRDANVGEDLRAALELDDSLFTLKLTPNRGDCLSVYGVAREVAAITATTLKAPEAASINISAKKALPVRVAEPAACPLYCGRVISGINMRAPIPAWMSRRLAKSGVRSHGAVVDVTNYVMLELGQPLHAFDLTKISGAVSVRFGKTGEKLELINGEAVRLDPGFLVIADEKNPLALAGIMGGQPSAIGEETRDLFLESAFFEPSTIAGKARELNLATDSAYRFERGVDFLATRDALERATALLLSICGGEAGPISEAAGTLPAREPIPLRASRLFRVLGVNISETEMSSILRRLQFSFSAQKDALYVLPPSFRFDLKIEEDLIEELARLYGYNRIPPIPGEAPQTILPQTETARSMTAIKARLTARDYHEIVSYSFVDSELNLDLGQTGDAVKLVNPLSSEMAVLRTNLAVGLIECLRANVKRKQSRARVFESGTVFLVGVEAYQETERLAGLVYGTVAPEQWGVDPRLVDFYDVKADVEALFHPQNVKFALAEYPALHPGKSARILLNQKEVGVAGQLHPGLQQRYELPLPVFLFEVDLGSLIGRTLPAVEEVSKFPPVRRDLAVIVPEVLETGEVLDAMRAKAPPQVSEVGLFDVYRGEPLAVGEKSLAFRVLFQDTQKTLNDEEVEAIMADFAVFLGDRFNARLREQGVK